MSGKLRIFEQSYSEVRFENHASTLITLNYRFGNDKNLKKDKFKFSESFLQNYKKRHISKTTRISAVKYGGKTRNP